MDEITLTLSSPMTEEQWDMVADYDFNHTNEITFHTKHGKIVKFVKESAQSERKKGKWRTVTKKSNLFDAYSCSECNGLVYGKTNFCPYCGADMRGEKDENN